MKRISLTVILLLALSTPAFGDGKGSTFLSQREAKSAIGKKASRDTVDADSYSVHGCWRINRRTVKCYVDYYDAYDDYLCHAIYRAKIYLHDLNTLYTRVTWSGC